MAALAVAAAALIFGTSLRAADDQHQHHQHEQPQAQSEHQGHEHHQHQAAAKEAASSAKVKYGDAVLVNQDGKKVKLKSEVFGDRVVVLDFAYTTCTTVCPVLTATLVKVQNDLGESVGKDVQIVTITVDPARDTPARLKEYAGKHGVKDGWMWLTGPLGTVNEVLDGFDAYNANFEEHPPMVLVGDPVAGKWTRFYGFADPKDIVAKVEELRAARGPAKKAGG
jgi:protein SCO1/2